MSEKYFYGKTIYRKKLAMKYGDREATILEFMIFWTLKNYKENPRCVKDGYVWMYKSVKELSTNIYPWWKPRQINHILKKLCDKKAIYKGTYGLYLGYHATWYRVSEEALKIVQGELIDEQQIEFGDIKNGKLRLEEKHYNTFDSSENNYHNIKEHSSIRKSNVKIRDYTT